MNRSEIKALILVYESMAKSALKFDDEGKEYAKGLKRGYHEAYTEICKTLQKILDNDTHLHRDGTDYRVLVD
jgi:hypothetical protein